MALKIESKMPQNIIDEELTSILQEVDWESDPDDDSVAVDVRPDVPVKSAPVEVVKADKNASIG